MPAIIINTYSELDKWLSENNYFENGYILEIEKSPLIITIGYIVSGSYKANEERQMQVFKLEPLTIVEWNYDESVFTTSSDYCIKGIAAIENLSGFGLSFVHKSSFSLITDSLKLNEPTIVTDTFKPWTSDTEIYAVAEIDNVPSPEFWLKKLKEKGHALFYRYIYGEIKPVEQIPYPDYSGYYLQMADRVATTSGGIFIRDIKQRGNFTTVSFQRQDQFLVDQWLDLTRILASLSNVTIHCGNCQFTGTEWERYLRDRVLPVMPAQ